MKRVSILVLSLILAGASTVHGKDTTVKIPNVVPKCDLALQTPLSKSEADCYQKCNPTRCDYASFEQKTKKCTLVPLRYECSFETRPGTMLLGRSTKTPKVISDVSPANQELKTKAGKKVVADYFFKKDAEYTALCSILQKCKAVTCYYGQVRPGSKQQPCLLLSNTPKSIPPPPHSVLATRLRAYVF